MGKMGKNKKGAKKFQNKKHNREAEKFSIKKTNFKQKNDTENKLSCNLSQDQINYSLDVDMNIKAEIEGINQFNEIKDAIKDNSCKLYNKHFRKVVAESDILLEILDARDPLGTRCSEIHKIINEGAEQKPIIVVLNKADLVLTENLKKWLKYFKSIHPAVPFKSSTQKQNFNLGSKSFKSIKDEKYLQNSISFGTDLLMSMLGKYFRHKGVKVTVGVVGIPNVGKSSVINSLARGKRCAVGCKPGVTRSLQKIQIDKKIMLIDSPGIIFPSETSLCSVYQNGQNVSDIKDPVLFAENILKRASKDYFCNLYGVSDYSSYNEFLAKKALKMGKFIAGTPDIDAAAKVLLNDWNSGKIRYCTEPPEELYSTHISSKIITSSAEIFKQEENDDEDYFEKAIKLLDDKVVCEGPTFTIPETSTYKINNTQDSGDKKVNQRNTKKIDPVTLLEGNRTINKDIKRLQKKKKKMVTRTEKKIDEVSDILEGFSMKTENCMTDN